MGLGSAAVLKHQQANGHRECSCSRKQI